MAYCCNQKFKVGLLLFSLLAISSAAEYRRQNLEANEALMKNVTLKSSDGVVFEVNKAVVFVSDTIKHIIEENGTNNAILLAEVNGKILSKVIEYCKMHIEAQSLESKELKIFDSEFVKVDHDTLFGIFLASNYLKIESLRDLISQTVGNMMKGKTPAEIRKMFNISDDCKPEGENKYVEENQWAFQ
ncbi:hypothetical protein LguiB_001802 [Lonicera macranthoides]